MHVVRPLPQPGNRNWWGHYQDIDLAVRELQALTHPPVVWEQPAPAATWIIPHTLGRLPNVACFDQTGTRMLPDEHASTTSLTLIFATPMAGTAVLT